MHRTRAHSRSDLSVATASSDLILRPSFHEPFSCQLLLDGAVVQIPANTVLLEEGRRAARFCVIIGGSRFIDELHWPWHSNALLNFIVERDAPNTRGKSQKIDR